MKTLFKLFVGVLLMTTVVSHAAPGAEHPAGALSREMVLRRFDSEVLSLVPETHFYPAKFMIPLLKKYSVDELARILEDFKEIDGNTFKTAQKGREFIAAAGGPGSGKSTLLEREIDESYAYCDPDRRGILSMSHTYRRDRENGVDADEAYGKWREASIFIANVLLAKALDQGYKVAFGTTFATPRSRAALEAIGNTYNKDITILHLSSPKEVCVASERKRREDDKVVQCTWEDLEEKGRGFYDRWPDFLATASTIRLFYRSAMSTITEVAKWTRDEMVVIDASSYQSVITLHDEARSDPGYFKRELAQTRL